MDSYRIFHADTHLRTQQSKFWTPKSTLPDPPNAPAVPPGLHLGLGMDLGWFGEGHMCSSIINNS